MTDMVCGFAPRDVIYAMMDLLDADGRVILMAGEKATIESIHSIDGGRTLQVYAWRNYDHASVVLHWPGMFARWFEPDEKMKSGLSVADAIGMSTKEFYERREAFPPPETISKMK